MAAPPPAAGPLEGMEDHRCQAAQPANTRHLRKRGPQMGRRHQEILESRRLPDPPGVPAQLPLEPPRPDNPQPHLAASPPSGLTNRRMRTRMSGGVRGGGATRPLLDSRVFLRLAVFGSLRWGELAALRRCDVDVETGAVRISRQLTEQPGGPPIFGPPKSAAASGL